MTKLAREAAREVSAGSHVKVAYIMSRFPKLTETFVLYEMLAVERLGHQVEVYPLRRERTKAMHPEAAKFVERAHFHAFVSAAILRSHLRFLVRTPGVYLRTLLRLLRANLTSRRYFLGALGLFPKAVYFAERMAEQGVSHVHAHFASHPAATAWVIHRLVGIPYSFTAHGSDLHRDRHMLREKVEEASLVVAISQYNRQVILAECGEKNARRVTVLHCGVDTAVFHPADRGLPGSCRAPLHIVCTGTLHEVKGQTHLLEACRLLAERRIDFMCSFVGDGPDQKALEQQAIRAGIQDRVRFLGRCTRTEITRLLAGADVLAAPSVPTRNGRREGIPVAIMEGAASGLPVVASRLSGIPELIEDDKQGLLVPPGDAEGLARALERLARSPSLRHQLGREGRAKVQSEFDLDTNALALARTFSPRRGAAR